MKKYALLTSAALSAFLLAGCSDEPEAVEQEEVAVEVVEETPAAADLEKAYADLAEKTKQALTEAEEAVEALETLKDSQEALEDIIEKLNLETEEKDELSASELAAKELREAAARLEQKAQAGE